MKNSYKNSTSYYSFKFQPRFFFFGGEFWLLGHKKTKANATYENDFCEKRTPKVARFARFFEIAIFR
jgi:hypothetical protein